MFPCREPVDDDLFPFAMAPEAPGSVAACCATRAELRRGLRVDVPTKQLTLFNIKFRMGNYSGI